MFDILSAGIVADNSIRCFPHDTPRTTSNGPNGTHAVS